jgi:hypothetical protein
MDCQASSGRIFSPVTFGQVVGLGVFQKEKPPSLAVFRGVLKLKPDF